MILTLREIVDLADYAGISISSHGEGELDQEFYIHKCSRLGILNDDGDTEHYSYIVRCDGCEENEAHPLGQPVKESEQ